MISERPSDIVGMRRLIDEQKAEARRRLFLFNMLRRDPLRIEKALVLALHWKAGVVRGNLPYWF